MLIVSSAFSSKSTPARPEVTATSLIKEVRAEGHVLQVESKLSAHACGVVVLMDAFSWLRALNQRLANGVLGKTSTEGAAAPFLVVAQTSPGRAQLGAVAGVHPRPTRRRHLLHGKINQSLKRAMTGEVDVRPS